VSRPLCRDSVRTVQPGEAAVFTIKVRNRGNDVDSFELEIGNLRDLIGRHWTITLNRTRLFDVEPGGFRWVRLSAQRSGELSLYSNEQVGINFTISSMNDAEKRTSTGLVAHLQGTSRSGTHTPTTIGVGITAVTAGGVAVFLARAGRRRKMLSPPF